MPQIVDRHQILMAAARQAMLPAPTSFPELVMDTIMTKTQKAKKKWELWSPGNQIGSAQYLVHLRYGVLVMNFRLPFTTLKLKLDGILPSPNIAS